MKRVRDIKLTGDEWMDRALEAKERKAEEKKIKLGIAQNGFWSATVITGAAMVSIYFT